MGGNAFENLKRLNKKEYLAYEEDVLSWLTEKFTYFAPVKYFRSKDSFGDLDIVVQKPKLDRAVFEAWVSEKGVNPATDIYYNNDFISIKYKDFQTDLIFVSEEFFETAQFYYAYNDLNNLTGRIAHKFGVKFGWDGLTYQLRTESGHKAKKVQLSTDPREIYAFLGYDYDVWEKGFNDLNEIFEFVKTSPFFNPDIYLYDNLNNTNKTRNRKRATYRAFLEDLETYDGKSYVFEKDKSVYLVRVHNAFPSGALLNQLLEYAKEAKVLEERREKFNGNMVMEITGKKGKDLGGEIQGFKKAIEEKHRVEFDSWLDQNNREEVVKRLEWFKSKKAVF